MTMQPKREEIDHRTIKLIVGVIAISLPFLTSAFASNAIASISASYYEGGWSQSIFVGFPFARSSSPRRPSITDRDAPQQGGRSGRARRGPVPRASATATRHWSPTFTALRRRDVLDPRVLLPRVLQRAMEKGYPQAKVRAAIYVACGRRILLAIAALAYDHFRAVRCRAEFALRFLRRERRAHRLRHLVAHRQPHDPGDRSQRGALFAVRENPVLEHQSRRNAAVRLRGRLRVAQRRRSGIAIKVTSLLRTEPALLLTTTW